MSKTGGIPDAWDDDWEVAADRPEAKAVPEAAKISKSQRRAQHLEQQKQLWDSAENPDRFHWLEAQGVVPLKPDYKPQVQLLSRRPVIAKRDDGVAGLSLNDDSDDDARRKRELDLEERQRRAKIEREEKQRKYAEARQRILGGGGSSPGPTPAARTSSHGREGRRLRGKMNGNPGSGSASSADQSPARSAAAGEKQLFDPNDMGRRMPGRETPVTALEDQPLRQPRGPDQSGRGGFNFAARGGRAQG